MPDFGNAFDELADQDNIMEAGMVLAGLGGSVVLKNGIESRGPDLPDPVYGVGVAAAAYSMDYKYVAIGGLGHAGISLAERFDFKSTVEEAGA